MVKRWSSLALLGCLLAACEGSTIARTQLMLVADTDVPGPNRISFNIVGPDRRPEPRDGDYTDASDLPRTLALVHTEGPLGPFEVTASIMGTRGLITRTHQVSFVRGKTLLVPLHLAEQCANHGPCMEPEQCDEAGKCISELLASADLMDYSEEPRRVWATDAGSPDASVDRDASPNDASLPDAGDSGPLTDLQDCQGVRVDILSNKDHCGGCGMKCVAAAPGDHSSGEECRAGRCYLVCDEGYADCNGRPGNGCEIDVATSKDHCGGCNMECRGNGKKCVSGVCN